MKVAPVINWSFRNVEEQVNAKGRLSIAMEVRNEGNAVDGLTVQLQSSHSVDMGFIPPDIAVYEDGVSSPVPLKSTTSRSIQTSPYEPGFNFLKTKRVTAPSTSTPPFVPDSRQNSRLFTRAQVTTSALSGNPNPTRTGDLIGVAWPTLLASTSRHGGVWSPVSSWQASSSTRRSSTENDASNKKAPCPTSKRKLRPMIG